MGAPATSSVHALKLTSVTVLAVTEISLSLPPHYTPLTGQYQTPLISGLVEPGDNGATVDMYNTALSSLTQTCSIYAAAADMINTVIHSFKGRQRMEFFLTAQNKSIHVHNLSKIANILRTQACTLRKSIYDKAYDKSQVLAISTLEHFKGQRNCLTMPWR